MGTGLAMGDRVSQHGLLAVERGVLVGARERRRVELVDLVAQKVDLACPRPFVTSECRQLGIDLRDGRPGGAQRLEVDLPVVVERGTLGRRPEQALVGVLAVQVDDPFGDLGERAGGRQPAVDIRPRPAIDRYHPREHDLGARIVPEHEPAVDAGLAGAGAHHRRIGATTDEELDRFDDHRLAGAGLPRHRRQTRSEDQLDAFDHAEVLDVQLGEHPSSDQ